MNIRQLKKQYKRKHGYNPPKGYSRAQIRSGIKRSFTEEFLHRGTFHMNVAIKNIVATINKAIPKLRANLVTIGQAVKKKQEDLERHGYGYNMDSVIIDEVAFNPESEGGK